MLRGVFQQATATMTSSLRFTSARLATTSATSSNATVSSAPEENADYLPPDIQIPRRVHRENESIETKRARLLYQSRKRGILESDLLCSTFAEKYLGKMGEEELERYDRLLDENDWDLYYWTSGERAIPERLSGDAILLKMKEHFKNEARLIIRMPELKK